MISKSCNSCKNIYFYCVGCARALHKLSLLAIKCFVASYNIHLVYYNFRIITILETQSIFSLSFILKKWQYCFQLYRARTYKHGRMLFLNSNWTIRDHFACPRYCIIRREKCAVQGLGTYEDKRQYSQPLRYCTHLTIITPSHQYTRVYITVNCHNRSNTLLANTSDNGNDIYL